MGNYIDMRNAGIIGGDKYFHCKANCEAVQRGEGGQNATQCISDSREWVGRNVKGDEYSDSTADQEANHYGDCRKMCAPYRPNGLPSRY